MEMAGAAGRDVLASSSVTIVVEEDAVPSPQLHGTDARPW